MSFCLVVTGQGVSREDSKLDVPSGNSKKKKGEKVEVEYDTPFRYCCEESAEARKITGVRHHGPVQEPSPFDIQHEQASRLFRVPDPPASEPAQDRPYMPVAVDPETLRKMSNREIEVDPLEYKRAKRAEQRKKEKFLKAMREDEAPY